VIRHGFTQRGLRRNHGLWTAAGSEAPRRFWMPPVVRKAVSPLRSATAVQNFSRMVTILTESSAVFK